MSPSNQHHRPCTRRGVLLLLVLSMLTMFGLLGLTFVLTADQHRRGAEWARQIDQYADPPGPLLQEAFAKIVCGDPPVPTSARYAPAGIRAHGLLDGMYGNRAMGGAIGALAPVAGGTRGGSFRQLQQLIRIPVAGPSGPPPVEAPGGPVTTDPYRCVGCVLTFTSGPCAGASTRVMSFSDAPPVFQILATSEVCYEQLNAYLRGGNPPIHYVVNGVPFSGPGFGWGSQGGSLRITDAALLPNARCNANPELAASAPVPTGLTGVTLQNCSANSDYTAPDYQHMLLAMLLPADVAAASNGGVSVPIPSMHRAELIHYWIKQHALGVKRYADFGASADRAAFLQQMMFRPIGAELKGPDGRVSRFSPHPRFTGSNWKFNPLWDGTPHSKYPGRWDVDNLGAGVPDSIWMDLGFSARSAANGKLYKPLVAILCVDLDGRLNLNAHGCPEQATDSYYTQTALTNPGGGSGRVPPQTLGACYFAGDPQAGSTPYAGNLGAVPGNVSAFPLAKGQGYGPAEISLRWLLSATSGSAYANLLGGVKDARTGAFTEGRYGDNRVGARPGRFGLYNPAWLNKEFAYGGDYWSFLTTPASYAPDAYGTPPDLTGHCAIGLDLAGRPIYYGLGTATSTQPPNSPYELNLAARAEWRMERNAMLGAAAGAVHNDNPFTPAELESLLRPYDFDAGNLPRRIANAVGRDVSFAIRNEVTTEQWDAPVPAAAIPPGVMKDHQLGSSIVDLLVHNDVPRALWPKLLPPDLLSGLRMDINRPFGPGWDEDGYGVPDQPRYAAKASKYRPQVVASARIPALPCGPSNARLGAHLNLQSVGAVQFDAGNTGDGSQVPVAAGNGYGVREAYARGLYVLACLLCDKKGLEARARMLIDTTNTYKLTVQEKAASMLAQWAVNVIDFRDRDAIMTAFHYDPQFYVNPAGGWHPQAIVFGVERPELLIMETLAFHDRRTEDLATEQIDPTAAERAAGRRSPGTERDADPKNTDSDMDQRWRPQGSLFVKLYNPWSNYDAPSGDLHKSPSKGWSRGVHLDQLTPPANGPASPVWRLAISKPTTANEAGLADPDNPIGYPSDRYGRDRPSVLRSVYFVDLSQHPAFARAVAREQSAAVPGSVNYPYYPSAANNPGVIAPVLPGRYAVIGPAEANPAAVPTGLSACSTPIGLKRGAVGFDDTSRQIVLDPRAGRLQVLNNGNPGAASGVPPAALVAIDAAYYGGPLPRRLSVSEPDPPASQYYPTADAAGQALSGGQYQKPYDHSVDEYAHGKYAHGSAPQTAGPRLAPDVWPLMSTSRDVDAVQAGRGFRLVHLQRLANPLMPWNNDPASANFNPYRTVDSMAVDLSVFNGVTSRLATRPANPAWEGYPGTLHLISRERGMNDFLLGAVRGYPFNLWKQEAIEHAVPTAEAYTAGYPRAAGQVVTAPLVQSLGYLNHSYGSPRTAPRSANYAGDPRYPMPWLTWNNRPYISPLELLLVPWTSSSQLLRPIHFTIAAPNVATDPFAPLANPPHAPLYDCTTNPFAHLTAFFDSAGVGASPQLHRILEFLRVPSRFVGTEVELNPVALQNGTGTHLFHPPFHRVSTYREPGRINLNTLYSPRVWQGLMNGFPDPSVSPLTNPIAWGYAPAFAADSLSSNNSDTLWARFIWSRRGYKNNTAAQQQDNYLYIDPNHPLPTRFANPFRSYAGAAFTHASQLGAMRSEIDATLLRRDPALPTRPLFQYDATITPQKSDGLKVNAIQHPENPDRNPYFRYAGLQRLGNLVTTRSNVYAVWLTVGYFEVLPNPGGPDALHPDGYQLAEELGSDTGAIKRHRAIFLFDRTIPMGFVRGRDLAYQKGMLLGHIIE